MVGGPGGCDQHKTGHGRIERRTVKVTSVTRGIPSPNADLALQVIRDRRQGKAATETVYAIFDLTWGQTTPEQLAQHIRGHWRIQDCLHWVRDVTLDEDASQIRAGTSAQAMATIPLD